MTYEIQYFSKVTHNWCSVLYLDDFNKAIKEYDCRVKMHLDFNIRLVIVGKTKENEDNKNILCTILSNVDRDKK